MTIRQLTLAFSLSISTLAGCTCASPNAPKDDSSEPAGETGTAGGDADSK